MAKQNWRYLLFLLTAHHPNEKLDHTIRVGFGGRYIYLCSRCTGIMLAMLIVFVSSAFGLQVPNAFYLPLIAFLPLFAVSDWFTQSAKLRKSNTTIRVTTGLLLGIAEALSIQLLLMGLYFEFLVAFAFAGIYALSVYLIAYKTKCLDAYVDEWNSFK
ncbi:MAG: DUF2085 domain-containing protein [Candidatus Bathyarchaeota archaeon]|nr:DUF2085 domain-containing protein [Candidatus Bathyarchaeota archaeon]